MVPTDAQALIGTLESVVQMSAAPFRGAHIGTYGHQVQPSYRLLEAAMRACDHWNDSPAARQEMRRQLAAVPPEHHAGLLEHFDRTYPAQEADPWAP